ncbi:hypothetical protein vseg_015862 [Gypsophila vaccaria]
MDGLHEYVKLFRSSNPPRVVIDNDSSEDATVLKVDDKLGMLIKVVELLCDMNIVIKKAYISSEGGWFMDVFHVTDIDGNKIRGQEVISYIQKSIQSDASFTPSARESIRLTSPEANTSSELSETDKPGSSEVCGIISYKDCQVTKAEGWIQMCRDVDLTTMPIRNTIFESCLYMILPPETTVASLLTSFISESPKPQNLKRTYLAGTGRRCSRAMFARDQSNVRVRHFPRVNGKGSKISRIK